MTAFRDYNARTDENIEVFWILFTVQKKLIEKVQRSREIASFVAVHARDDQFLMVSLRTTRKENLFILDFDSLV